MQVCRRVKIGASCAAGMPMLSGCLASNSKTSGDLGANKGTSKTVNILVAFSGPQVDSFKSGVDPYAKSQGITIKWASDANFNADVVNKVMDVKSPKSQLVTGLEDVGTVNGKVYGIPPSINVKSLVFYPKKTWTAANLTPPTTLDDLLTFSANLKSQGKTPWCMGIESGTGTGWPATDWM